MRKKISVENLRLGMFLDKLDGSWLKHPFWKSSFKLTDKKDVKAIIDAGITHVWIDTAKGLDVAGQAPKPAAPEKKPPSTQNEKPAVVPLEDELENARETLARAKQATVAMFSEARMGNSIKADDAAPLVEEISASVARNPAAMLSISRMKTKDDYTYLHSVAVCALMIALGKELGYKGSLQSLGMAGLLHDVGKMAIPEDVLNKPGKLTDNEFEVIKNHPRRGWEMLKESFGVDEIALDVCLHHHEKMDGSGYPDRLKGEEISLEARMGAICDVYDAITSDRCYKKGWEPAEALKKMAEWKDGHFDDTVFKAFVKTVGIYPVGTLIKLHSGRLGIVTEQSAKTLLKPKIKIFYSSTSRSAIPPKVIDLTRSQETIESIEEPETWGFDRKRVMDMLG